MLGTMSLLHDHCPIGEQTQDLSSVCPMLALIRFLLLNLIDKINYYLGDGTDGDQEIVCWWIVQWHH